MSRKVDDQLYARIIELKHKHELTIAVISERLGISERTIRIYLRAYRLGQLPYEKSCIIPQ